MKLLFIATIYCAFMLNINASAFYNSSTEITPEMRESAAQIHEQMAACLRMDKPFIVCRQEMKNACIKLMGPGPCQMNENCSTQVTPSKKTKLSDSYNGGIVEDDDDSSYESVRKYFPLRNTHQRLLK